MSSALRYIKTFFRMVLSLALFIFLLLFVIFMVSQGPSKKSSNINMLQAILPFSISENEITYDTKKDAPKPAPVSVPVSASTKANYRSFSTSERQEVINRAKSMTEVKWTPQYNLYDDKGNYTFKKGQTYQGVPYTMDLYQVKSPEDFLNKIKGSKILFGNDCSGFVSAAWGIKRQTTYFFYSALKDGGTVDGRAVCEISWDELQMADALLVEDGHGHGHIMLYINSDKGNSDNLNVYEQNIATSIPYEPLPVARKDVRSKAALIKQGYIPIRLMNINS